MIMKRRRSHLTLLSSIPLLAGSLANATAAEPTIYDAVVKPILESRCVECHGEKKAKGKLRLDTPEHIQKGGGDGRTVVGGKSGESSLFMRVTLPEGDEDLMPPKGDPLSKEQIEALTWWIDRLSSLKYPGVVGEAAGEDHAASPVRLS